MILIMSECLLAVVFRCHAHTLLLVFSSESRCSNVWVPFPSMRFYIRSSHISLVLITLYEHQISEQFERFHAHNSNIDSISLELSSIPINVCIHKYRKPHFHLWPLYHNENQYKDSTLTGEKSMWSTSVLLDFQKMKELVFFSP